MSNSKSRIAMHRVACSAHRHSFSLVPLLFVALVGCKTSGGQGSSTKAINGVAVQANDPIAASTVGLVWDKTSSGTAACSGTLIDSRHVLTAAHCFDTNLTGPVTHRQITFGITRDPKTVAGVDTKPVAVVEVASYVANSDYHTSPVRLNKFTNADLAVITLAADAPQGFNAVGLLTPTDSLKADDAIIPAGFGVTVWDDVSTAGTLHSIQQHLDSDPDPSAPTISYQIRNQDTGIDCFGDSGGPIYVQRDGKLSLAAVISSGTGYRCSNGAAFATDVRPLRDWVQRAMTGTLAASEGFVFSDSFKDTDGTVYPYCSRSTGDDGSGTYKFGNQPELKGPGGKCKLVGT